MFETLRNICEHGSTLRARNHGLKTGEMSPALGEQAILEAKRIEQQNYTIMSHCRSRGLKLINTYMDSSDEVEGEVIEFRAFVTFFGFPAPKLLSAVNDLGRMFNLNAVTDENGETLVKPGYPTDIILPDTFISAMYSVTGDLAHSVDSNTGDQQVLKGNWGGGLHSLEEGFEITIDAVQPNDLLTMVHEIIHAKWPNELVQQDPAVDGIADTIIREIKESGGVEMQISEGVEQERLEALEAFQGLEEELSEVITL